MIDLQDANSGVPQPWNHPWAAIRLCGHHRMYDYKCMNKHQRIDEECICTKINLLLLFILLLLLLYQKDRKNEQHLVKYIRYAKQNT